MPISKTALFIAPFGEDKPIGEAYHIENENFDRMIAQLRIPDWQIESAGNLNLRPKMVRRVYKDYVMTHQHDGDVLEICSILMVAIVTSVYYPGDKLENKSSDQILEEFTSSLLNYIEATPEEFRRNAAEFLTRCGYTLRRRTKDTHKPLNEQIVRELSFIDPDTVTGTREALAPLLDDHTYMYKPLGIHLLKILILVDAINRITPDEDLRNQTQMEGLMLQVQMHESQSFMKRYGDVWERGGYEWSTKSDKDCWVVTAYYGDPFESHVVQIRDFRTRMYQVPYLSLVVQLINQAYLRIGRSSFGVWWKTQLYNENVLCKRISWLFISVLLKMSRVGGYRGSVE